MISSSSLYFVILTLFYGSLFVFLRGLLPVDQIDEQKFPLGTDVQDYESDRIDKMVLMVVDGLRADMLVGPQPRTHWQKLHSHLSERASVCSISHLQPPTVTMPRIKAITSGRIPKFVDVLHNFFAERLHHDTWIKRLVSRGWSFEFYGDDTWLKLFPNTFAHFDGTTSFFVNDYHEWNGLILHYLGLDHIGHVEGPRSRKMRNKLLEMDVVADKVLSQLAEIESRNKTNWIFILTGDHGISDRGGHGGSSYAETHTGLVVISSKKKNELENVKREITTINLLRSPVLSRIPLNIQPCLTQHTLRPTSEQVDLATFIGLLVGNGIPMGSFGSVPHLWIQTFFPNQTYTQLGILHRLMKHFAARAGCQSTSTNSEMLSSVCLSSSISSALVDRYNSLVNKLHLAYKYRNRSDGQVETTPQIQSLILEMCELVAQFQQTLLGTAHKLQVDLMVVGCGLIWLVTVIVCIVVKVILLRNVSEMEHSLLKAVSLVGSSFSEEEHQFWYYFGASTLGLLGVLTALQYPHRSSALLTSSPLMVAWMTVLWLDRLLLQRIHQTGDKWIHLPDISDWLYSAEHAIWLWPTQLATWMTFILLRLVTVLKSSWPKPFLFRAHLLRWSPVLSCILITASQMCYRWAVATSKGDGAIFAAKIAYAVLIIDLLVAIKWHRMCKHYQLIADQTDSLMGNAGGEGETGFWTNGFLHPVISFGLLVGFLGRPAVSLLWIGVIVKEYLLSRIIEHTIGALKSCSIAKKSSQTTELRFLCTWLVYWTQGWVTFFQQGNSLSLATVDVSVAYVGFRSYHPVIAGLLLLVYTYAGPLYWQLAYLFRFHSPVTANNAAAKQLPAGVAPRLALSRLAFVVLPVAFAATVCLLLREHLFIWTVFTPKLVYLALFQLIYAPILCAQAIL